MHLKLKLYINLETIQLLFSPFKAFKLGFFFLPFKILAEILQVFYFLVRSFTRINNGPDQEDFFKNTNRFFLNYLSCQFCFIQLSVVTTQTLICSSNPNEIGFTGNVYAHIPLLNCTFLIFKWSIIYFFFSLALIYACLLGCPYALNYMNKSNDQPYNWAGYFFLNDALHISNGLFNLCLFSNPILIKCFNFFKSFLNIVFNKFQLLLFNILQLILFLIQYLTKLILKLFQNSIYPSSLRLFNSKINRTNTQFQVSLRTNSLKHQRSFFHTSSLSNNKKNNENSSLSEKNKKKVAALLARSTEQNAFEQLVPLTLTELKTKPVAIYNNYLEAKEILKNSYKNVGGIYLLHNLVNGKQYVGSSHNLNARLSTYFYPSRLTDNRYISKSLLKYGHHNFSLVILELLGPTLDLKKLDVLNKEQYYIDLYKPVLNLNPTAGSSLGFKHSEESKQKITESKLGKALSPEIKMKLSKINKGKNNPFFGKSHSQETLIKLSEMKKGKPVLNKSKEFIDNMYKDRRGALNPMFGKTKSLETLAKLRTKVYVYEVQETGEKTLIKIYDGIVEAKKDLKMGYDTLKKCCETNKIYKSKMFSYVPL